jgi:hypothetical protein
MAMKMTIQLTIETEEGEKLTTRAVAELERTDLQAETLGLTLAEAKTVLHKLQEVLVAQQVADYTASQRYCPSCHQARTRKGRHRITFRTLFGKLALDSVRFYRCPCEARGRSSVSPLAELLTERTAPELSYLETKWAALISYGMAARVLTDILPLDHSLHPMMLARHVAQVAERSEAELGDEQGAFIEGCPRDWASLPLPEGPLTVGIDGGYVHARDATGRADRWFEVIVGKSLPAEGQAKCFSFVQQYDTKPKRRLFEHLKSQGMQNNQQVVFLSDGGETVRNLQFYLHPDAEYLLEWFHPTMRITVMKQMAVGLRIRSKRTRARIDRLLERLKWALWHGNVYKTLQKLEDLEEDLEMLEPSPNLPKLIQAVQDFTRYIQANHAFIPNYGDRYRYGEKIATGFVESAVNQVISKRFVKRQQMRWTKKGAHLLLQVRTKVLNKELHSTFERWYTKMSPVQEEFPLAA